GVGETSSAATPTTGITDVGSSGLLAHDSISHGSNDLESASQTNDHLESAPERRRRKSRWDERSGDIWADLV
ncbi:hypothetical protein A2U01_0108548, partial [Trifolium medium]|nr:hypothetical protein [Trifolium medium]